MAFRITQDLHHTVIHPSWTLAPQSCALEFPAMAVKHLLSIADDPQYEGKEIWLGGLSAGGWCALRLLLALCEEALDSKDDARRSRLNAVLDRIPGIFLFCPSVTLEMDDEAKRLGNLASTDPRHDKWLLTSGSAVDQSSGRQIRQAVVLWWGSIPRFLRQTARVSSRESTSICQGDRGHNTAGPEVLDQQQSRHASRVRPAFGQVETLHHFIVYRVVRHSISWSPKYAPQVIGHGQERC